MIGLSGVIWVCILYLLITRYGGDDDIDGTGTGGSGISPSKGNMPTRNLRSLQTPCCHYLVTKSYASMTITIQTVSRFWATHKKHVLSRASVRWGIKLVSCLFWGKASLIILFILTLELLFAQPAYCEPATTNMTLCVLKREINGKGLPRNNEVMRARLAEQQVSDLEAGLPGGNLVADADVRAFMLDHIQSLKALLQGFAKKGDLPDPDLLSEIVGFLEPTSLDSILTTLIVRLRLVRGEENSGAISDILAVAERVRPLRAEFGRKAGSISITDRGQITLEHISSPSEARSYGQGTNIVWVESAEFPERFHRRTNSGDVSASEKPPPRPGQQDLPLSSSLSGCFL